MTIDQARQLFDFIRTSLQTRNLNEFHNNAQHVAQQEEQKDMRRLLLYYIRSLISQFENHDRSMIDNILNELNKYVVTENKRTISHIAVEINDANVLSGNQRLVDLKSISDFDDLLATFRDVEQKISDDLNLRNNNRLKL